MDKNTKFRVEGKYLVEIKQVINELVMKHQDIFGEKLLGVYVFGSLVTEDFDYGISDIDLLSIVSGELNADDLGRLDTIHSTFIEQHPEWENKIEISYLTPSQLRKHNPSHRFPVISPGEKLHFRTMDSDWILNRKSLYDSGVIVFGQDFKTLMDPVSELEFKSAIIKQASEWKEWIVGPEMKWQGNYQSYAVLTLCRLFYAYKNGVNCSKKKSAEWVKNEHPEWANVIDEAVERRKKDPGQNTEWKNKIEETKKFSREIFDLIK